MDDRHDGMTHGPEAPDLDPRPQESAADRRPPAHAIFMRPVSAGHGDDHDEERQRFAHRHPVIVPTEVRGESSRQLSASARPEPDSEEPSTASASVSPAHVRPRHRPATTLGIMCLGITVGVIGCIAFSVVDSGRLGFDGTTPAARLATLTHDMTETSTVPPALASVARGAAVYTTQVPVDSMGESAQVYVTLPGGEELCVGLVIASQIATSCEAADPSAAHGTPTVSSLARGADPGSDFFVGATVHPDGNVEVSSRPATPRVGITK
jgi:hypothetical protein